MSAHTTFIHLSDTHIEPPGTLAHGADTAANLRAVVARVREMNVDPAFFLITGDLSNHGAPESYEALRGLLDEMDEFGVPVLLTLGNHDSRVPFRRAILDEQSASDEYEPYFYSRTIGDIRVLALDSKVPDRIDGELGERQLAWLGEQLEESAAPGGDIIAFHHPCLPRGVPRQNDYLLQDSEALADLLASRPVLGILAGHSHVSSVASFHGTLHVTAPATAFLLDPSITEGGRALEGAGFNLCTVRDGRLLVNPIIMPGSQRELFRHGPPEAAIASEPAAVPAGD